MNCYNISNPTRSPRIIYDGIEGSQRPIKIAPGQTVRNVALGRAVVDQLRNARNDLIVTVLIPDGAREWDGEWEPWPETNGKASEPFPLAADTQPEALASLREEPLVIKPPMLITGMWGIGDNLHQRGPLKEIMKSHEVWLETCHYNIYHDLIEQGLKLIMRTTKLRAQAKTIERERGLFDRFWHSPQRSAPPKSPHKKFYYNKPEVDRGGSIAGALYTNLGLPVPEQADFRFPVKAEWLAQAEQIIRDWSLQKPLLIFRPPVLRKEWNGRVRNPDINAYNALFNAIRDQFFVVSIADLAASLEWIEGPEQEADIKLHRGELDFTTMAGLFKLASMVMSPAGFAPVLAQSVGTPIVAVYGGRESYRTTERGGAHLAPTLGIDPDKPCDCHSLQPHCGNRCQKHISLEPATARLQEFVATHCQKQRVANTLIFGTVYVDSPHRVDLTKHWMRLHQTMSPGCDFLIVDSQSPMLNQVDLKDWQGWRHGDPRARRMLFGFPDNIGHLSRKGKDGWGRAFCKGLEIAIELGYDYVVHIEGDSLFRLPVAPIIEQMQTERIDAASIPVQGMRAPFLADWIETGLMFFRTKYLTDSNFIARYNWPVRRVAPTPEVIVNNLLRPRLRRMPWKGQRSDKKQVTVDNVIGLDWVTHSHSDIAPYDKFMQHVLGGEAPGPFPLAANDLSGASESLREGPPLIKLNLGCGTNKLKGWENHDADVDVTKPLPYADNSAAYIFCEHCVEHIDYYSAIAFFKECRRVLAADGIFRIAVPSLETIWKCNDQDYYKFTRKWGPSADARGAMHAILYAHGHKTAWTASLLEATLYYAGFEDVTQCRPHVSNHPELTNIEGHHNVIGEKFNTIESCIFEGSVRKQMPPPLSASVSTKAKVAIVVAGGEAVLEEVAQAEKLCAEAGVEYEFYLVNDQIARFPKAGIAVSLHPDKVEGWLNQRNRSGLPPPAEVWCHRKGRHVVTHATPDWGGSSGLFAAKVAIERGRHKVLGCGVPMAAQAGHFLRKARWTSAEAFWRAWNTHGDRIGTHFRSFSGRTAEKFGQPSVAFLQD